MYFYPFDLAPPLRPEVPANAGPGTALQVSELHTQGHSTTGRTLFRKKCLRFDTIAPSSCALTWALRQVAAPSGQTLQVVVPPGLGPGQVFQVPGTAREDLSAGYGLWLFYGNLREKTVFHEYLQEACFDT